ncbi:hypothetical protein Hamer_G006460 [Homarus americanus]|uniref:Uncharacterized protein n=1 Tax=Homarus americanus TaxID=6706 RepID=A0A8J5JI39_HOMAM|nr:hypothetical protein Hamer_G006460 [Homarus americanus]
MTWEERHLRQYTQGPPGSGPPPITLYHSYCLFSSWPPLTSSGPPTPRRLDRTTHNQLEALINPNPPWLPLRGVMEWVFLSICMWLTKPIFHAHGHLSQAHSGRWAAISLITMYMRYAGMAKHVSTCWLSLENTSKAISWTVMTARQDLNICSNNLRIP